MLGTYIIDAGFSVEEEQLHSGVLFQQRNGLDVKPVRQKMARSHFVKSQ